MENLIYNTLYLNPLDLNYMFPKYEVLLDELVFVRSQKKTFGLYYLNSSFQLTIPSEYFVLFGTIDRMLGQQLKKKDDEFIWYGWNLWRKIMVTSDISLNEILSELLKIGTKNIRSWLKDNFELDFKPWILENITNSIEI